MTERKPKRGRPIGSERRALPPFDWMAWWRATRCLTPEERGVWIDCLVLLAKAPMPGKLTLSIDDWAAKLGLGKSCAQLLLAALVAKGVASDGEFVMPRLRNLSHPDEGISNASLTLVCRRMLRAERARIKNSLYVTLHRLRRRKPNL